MHGVRVLTGRWLVGGFNRAGQSIPKPFRIIIFVGSIWILLLGWKINENQAAACAEMSKLVGETSTGTVPRSAAASPSVAALPLRAVLLPVLPSAAVARQHVGPPDHGPNLLENPNQTVNPRFYNPKKLRLRLSVIYDAC